MARGSKKKYSTKQKRKARHIEDSVKERGGSEKSAARIAWATVNKESGGGKKGGSGAGKKTKKTSSRKGGKEGGRKTAKKTARKSTRKAAKKTSRSGGKKKSRG